MGFYLWTQSIEERASLTWRDHNIHCPVADHLFIKFIMDISIGKKNIYTMKEESLIGALVHKALDAFFTPKYSSLRAIPVTRECPEKG